MPFLWPAELATASAGTILHLVHWIEAQEGPVKRVIDLDPTSPLRDVADIQACVATTPGALDLLAITGYESDSNPDSNMVERKANGFYERVCKPDARFGPPGRAQGLCDECVHLCLAPCVSDDVRGVRRASGCT